MAVSLTAASVTTAAGAASPPTASPPTASPPTASPQTSESQTTQPHKATASEPALLPSIHWEQARAHADDKLDLPAGGRVTIGFVPRPDDRWKVGGAAPRALPAGRLTGRELGSLTRPAQPRPTPDSPLIEPRDVVGADPASAFLPAEEGTVDLAAKVTPTGLRKEIFGFLPYWELSDPSTTLDYSKISTIAYFGVGAAANGTLERTSSSGATTAGWRGWTSARLTGVINDAHRTHTRVVLTVQSFAWSTGGANKQKALLGSSTARATLARQIAAAIRDRGADGVNLDFEPLVAGYEAEFASLVRRVRSELDAVHAGYQVTFDTTGFIGNYPIEAATAAGAADAIFIMGYDYRTAGSSPVGSIAPTGGPRYDIGDTIRAYAARVPPSKLILGVPYYGRAWSTNSDKLNATSISGAKYGGSTVVVYSTGIGILQEKGRRWDTVEGVAWTAYRRENCTSTYGCVTSWRQLYLDDATALRRKYDLVNSYRLRGAGIWALGYDGTRPELWAAIKAKFVTDTTPPRSWITRLPSGQTSPGFVVRWGGSDDSAVSSYDIQVSTGSGSWATWLSRSKATSGLYPGYDGRRYSFRIRARDVKGNVGGWVAVPAAFPGETLRVGGFGSVAIDGLSVRSAPSTSAERLGAVSTGNLVAITGGPVEAEGYTWHRIRGALRDWPASATTHTDVWVATRSATERYVTPAAGPHQTTVAGQIRGLTFGDWGSASIGATTIARKHRSFSPNGDGRYDSLKLRWTNVVDLGSLELRVYRADGTTVGSIPLNALPSGARVRGWDGKIGGARVPNGGYYVTLVGTIGSSTHANPSIGFGGRVLLGRYGVRVATRLIPFTDVGSFEAAIEWLYMEDVTAGCSPTRFCPDSRVTRVQMAQFLARALDLPTTTIDHFDDDDGMTGESSINALAKAGLTTGCGARRFCPTRIVTRAQMAQFLARALRLPMTTTDYFDDDDGVTGEGSINAMARAGLTSGCAPRRFCPTQAISREQMAALLYRGLGQ
jgi:spore germination protein YaaH